MPVIEDSRKRSDMEPEVEEMQELGDKRRVGLLTSS